jgi:flagellar biosynthesis protein FliR
MPTDLTLATSTLFGFLLVLARIGGAFVLVPLPGMRTSLEPARVVLCLGITLALFPQWPAVEGAPGIVRLAGWVVSETALGVGIGVAASMLLEVYPFAAQALGFQAGYAYASTVDPTSEADSTVLIVFAQTAAGLLFFALGFDRELVRLFARSLETSPPGAFPATAASAEALIRLGQTMLAGGVRLALPLMALLALVDVALALAGRINAHLQLLSLALPVKMLAAVMMLSWLVALWPRLGRQFGAHVWQALHALVRF